MPARASRLVTWVCWYCENRKRSQHLPKYCANCHSENTFFEAETVSQEKSLGLISAEFPETPPVELCATGITPFDRLLGGGVAVPSTLALWGPGGSGKTRAALRILTQLGRTVFASLEMHPSLAVHTCRDSGARLQNVLIAGPEHCGDLLSRATDANARVLIVDSISVWPGSEPEQFGFLAHLTTWAVMHSAVAAVIVHSLKDGTGFKGPSEIRHWPDYLLRVQRSEQPGLAVITTEKSRFCPSDMSCALSVHTSAPDPSPP